MDKRILAICALCTVFMLAGCATTPEFKSLKEAECYVGTVPISERFTKFGIEAYAVKKPMSRKKSNDVDTVLGIGAAALTGNVLLAIPTPAPMWSDYKEIWGGVYFGKMPVIVYRSKPGEPVWDVVAEALMRAGPPPKSDSCIYEGIRFNPGVLNKSEYSGVDGKIVITDWLQIKLYFERKSKADPPCDEKAWQVYVDYVKLIANHTKSIIEEEFALPNRTRFCPAKTNENP